MGEDVAPAIFALTETQHLTSKAVSILTMVVPKRASEEDVVEARLDSFDAAFGKTKPVMKNAAKHG